MRPVLCLVTDRARCGGEDRVVEIVGRAAAAGVQLVQVREKDLEANTLYELVCRCVAAVKGTKTRVLVNDRVDIAVAACAHGVHLPSEGVPAARVRAIVPRAFLVGRSVHGVDEARRAATDGGLDYLVFGSVFPTQSKPGVAPAGVDRLRDVTAAVPLPVLAIGGITVERLGQVAAAGAAGIAAIQLFADVRNEAQKALQTLVAEAALAFDTAKRVP